MAQCSWVEWHDLDRVEGDLGLTLGPVCMPVASSSYVSAPLITNPRLNKGKVNGLIGLWPPWSSGMALTYLRVFSGLTWVLQACL